MKMCITLEVVSLMVPAIQRPRLTEHIWSRSWEGYSQMTKWF